MTPFSPDSTPFEMLAYCIQGLCLLSTASNLGDNAGAFICMLFLEEARLASWVSRMHNCPYDLHRSDIQDAGQRLSAYTG